MLVRALVVFVACLVALPAYAHPLVDRAVREYEGARFNSARDAISRAEAARDLSRSDLLRLLRTRALVDFAIGDVAALRTTLRSLLALEPDLALGADVPPAVRDELDRARAERIEPVALVVTADSAPDGARVRAHASGDSTHLVREVRVWIRPARGAWSVHRESATVPVSDGAVVEYAVSAFGPGGAVVVTQGTQVAPLRMRFEARHRGGDAIGGARDEGGVSSAVPWLVGAGALLAAGVAAVVIVLAVSADDDTRLGEPVVFPP